jgi:nicotinate-nucleotide pyrophosphorylase (carboxylating)
LPESFDIDAFVAATLAEDLGTVGDITSTAVIPADARFTGVMDSRDPIVVAGLDLAEAFQGHGFQNFLSIGRTVIRSLMLHSH